MDAVEYEVGENATSPPLSDVDDCRLMAPAKSDRESKEEAIGLMRNVRNIDLARVRRNMIIYCVRFKARFASLLDQGPWLGWSGKPSQDALKMPEASRTAAACERSGI